MAKIAGCDVLLKVSATSSGTGTTVGGQTGATLNRSAETMDVTDKTNSGWKESMAGLKEWSIDCDGFIVTADSGIVILDDAFDDRELVYCEITIGNQKYTGGGYIVDYPLEMPVDGAVTYSLSIAGATALTKTTVTG